MGQREKQKKSRKVGIIVAHPDDEILWTGASILIHPEWECFIYTLCRRHEEIGKALLSLWGSREIQTKEMWLFAYEDGQGAYYPHAERNAHRTFFLPKLVWERKYHILTDIYGFSYNSWETQTAPNVDPYDGG